MISCILLADAGQLEEAIDIFVLLFQYTHVFMCMYVCTCLCILIFNDLH